MKGVMSDWTRDAGIVEQSLFDILDPTMFSQAVSNIEKIPIYKQRNIVGHGMYAAALKKYAQYLSSISQVNIERDIEDILSDKDIKATDKIYLINARIGQGKYRKNLIDLWGRSSVTGYSEISMLIASHIKPWSRSSNKERLDKYNGFLLLPNLDKAFDRGLISFDMSGQIMISPLLHTPDILGIDSTMRIKLKTQQLPYIKYHRSHVYKAE